MTVKQARPKLRIALGVLLALDLAALVVLLTPLAGRRGDREQEYARVHQALQQELHKAAPLRNIDQKIAEAQQQVADFYKDRLPARDSAIAEELGKVAGENGVRFSGVRYVADDDVAEGLRRLQMDASIAGDYVKVVKFINALERDRLFFIVDSVNLAEQQGGMVRLELKLNTYLRQRGT